MRGDAAKRIEREFDEKCKTNHLFKEYVELHPECSMDELLTGWAWVQKLMEKVIQRTIRDLTAPHPGATLATRREEKL